MVDAVGVLYPYELTCQFVQISEFLKTCGIYVYKTSMEFDGWAEKLQKSGIEWRICLVNSFNQLDKVRKSTQNVKRNFFIVYGQETINENFFSEEIVRERDISSVIQNIDEENQCDGFLQSFFEYFKSNELYRALFAIHNIDNAEILLNDSIKPIDKAIDWLKENSYTGAAYWFVLAYLRYSLYKARREISVECFKKVKLLTNHILELEENYPGVDELEGDLYFYFQNNYIFGLLHYENCFNSYNYTAPYKLSKYWKNIVKSEKNELKCLKMAYECNRENYAAAFDLGRYYEDRSEMEAAVKIYHGIVYGLRKKEENNVLTRSEFSSLCKAHKRIGCIIYKDKDNPRYFEAIEQYKIIFQLWNDCEENRFILCFPEKYRREIVKSYKDSFNIDGVLFSLSKIYDLIFQNEKSETALEMAWRAYEGSTEKIDTEWM